MARRIASHAEFGPFTPAAHSHPVNRALHVLGTELGLALPLAGIVGLDWRLVLAPLVVGYGLAWAGHLVLERNIVERNRPATFSYPLWSLISDVRMFGLYASGRLEAGLDRRG